jgi:hypothetical protein
MKLDDPFGRLESRHQKGYETMRTTLREAGIETPQAAREAIRQAWRRGATVVVVGLSLLLVVASLLPNVIPLALGLGLFLIVWVTTSTINGQRYVNRYIEEELGRR